MDIRCRLGRHTLETLRNPERTDYLGRANPYFSRCRRCGLERDHPIARWDRPDPPALG